MISQKLKCENFASLHQQPGAFLIPNPWDIGSARLLQGLGFKALATTSSGLAYTLGRVDGEVTLEEKLSHCSQLAANTVIPINADFENGFADDPETIANNVLKLAGTGVAGCSIEDYSRDSHNVYDFNLSVDRIQAVVEAVATLGIPFMLTARAENVFRGINDLDDTIKRLKAYEAVGANVLYAPGIGSLDQLKRVTDELSTPFNVLAPFIRDARVEEFAEAGAKRISIGGALNWAAVNPILKAAKEMLERGSFNWTADMALPGEVNRLLS
jgi:2-methylisocitrate lyase-like PEP mutase family enzyme